MIEYIKNLSKAKKSAIIIFVLLCVTGIVMAFVGKVAEIIFYVIAFAFLINLYICARETKKSLVEHFESDHFEYNPQQQKNREMTLKKEKINIIFRQIIYMALAIISLFQALFILFY